jgi:hypothetical protein
MVSLFSNGISYVVGGTGYAVALVGIIANNIKSSRIPIGDSRALVTGFSKKSDTVVAVGMTLFLAGIIHYGVSYGKRSYDETNSDKGLISGINPNAKILN